MLSRGVNKKDPKRYYSHVSFHLWVHVSYFVFNNIATYLSQNQQQLDITLDTCANENLLAPLLSPIIQRTSLSQLSPTLNPHHKQHTLATTKQALQLTTSHVFMQCTSQNTIVMFRNNT